VAAETSKCKTCGEVIFWHLSQRTGKKYPTDSATDRRAFHMCQNLEKGVAVVQEPKRTVTGKTVEQRLEWLEKEVRALLVKLDGMPF